MTHDQIANKALDALTMAIANRVLADSQQTEAAWRVANISKVAKDRSKVTRLKSRLSVTEAQQILGGMR